MQNVNRLGLDYRFVHKNEAGDVLYDSGWLPNHLTDDGVELMFDVFFRDGTAPTGFAIGLNQVNLNQTSSLTDLNEVTGTNYGREAVDRDDTASGFPTLALDDGDMQIESATVQFENTGSVAWDGAVDAFMTAVMAGDDVLVGYRPLSATRTLQENDTLDVTFKVKGEQP